MSHIDEHGAITQHKKYGGDEGDSAFFSGHFELLRYIYPTGFHAIVKRPSFRLFFPDNDGRLVRHAKATRPWIREKDRGSRDQYTSWICLFALKSEKKTRPVLKDIAKLLFKRVGFFTNTKKNGILNTPSKLPDFITPEVLSVLLRGLIGKWGYPLYLLFDAWLCLDVLHTRRFKDDSDVANHLAVLMTSNLLHPTPLARLAMRLLDKTMMERHLREYFTIAPLNGWAFNNRRSAQNPTFLGNAYIEVLNEVYDDTV